LSTAGIYIQELAMAVPEPSALSPIVRFPNFREFTDLNSLSIVIQDLSVIYDVTTITVSPQYGNVSMPTTRIGPRRYSVLRPEDRLIIKRVSLSSPLETVFYTAISAPSILLSLKTFLDVLAKGTDIAGRIQTLNENRSLRSERLREAQLRNDILAEGLRRTRTENDLFESTIQEYSGSGSGSLEESRPRNIGHRTARDLTAQDSAQLIDEPMHRLYYYGGGELEIAGDESIANIDDEEPN
jgi:hypothetical protein